MRWNSWFVLFWGLLLAGADQLVAPSGEVLAGGLALAAPQATQAPLRRCGAAWTRQFGSDGMDEVTGMAVDGQGNIYVAGWSIGALPGQASAGGADIFIRKYGPGGREQWTRQAGSPDYDVAIGVAANGAGDSYVVGWTAGALPGQASFGRNDAFVARYGPSGEALWTRQFGSEGFEVAVGVAVDGQGNAYVAGWTSATLPGQDSAGGMDAFLRKYDASGTELWTRQFGSRDNEEATGISVSGDGRVYVSGWTSGELDGQEQAGGVDSFVSVFGVDGEALWTRQFGASADDQATDVAVDGGGHIYVTGWTWDSLAEEVSAGGVDSYVRQYDAQGNALWTRQFGSPSLDQPNSLVVDSDDSVYVVGFTNYAPPEKRPAASASAVGYSEEAVAADLDIFIWKYDAAGQALWSFQCGTGADDEARAVATNGRGAIYISGWTAGRMLQRATDGGDSGFLLRISPAR